MRSRRVVRVAASTSAALRPFTTPSPARNPTAAHGRVTGRDSAVVTYDKERTSMKTRGLTLLAAVAVALAAVAAAGARSSDTTLTGAGATFPFPLISKWIPAYDGATGVKINYSPIGSGGGIAAVTNRTVDFGASDAPLTSDQVKAAIKDGSGVVQIPWALSATSVMYSLPGAPQHLKRTRRIIADIYLGKITKSNGGAIARI